MALSSLINTANSNPGGRIPISVMNHACHQVTFNEDLLAYTFEYLRVDESLAVRLVNKLFASSFMRSYGVRDDNSRLSLQKTKTRYFCVSVPALQWCVLEMRAGLSARLCKFVAGAGCLTGLQWLRSQDPPCHWDERSCAWAAKCGHLSVLQWLRSQNPPGPWDAEACRYAVEFGHLAVLQWLRSQDPPCPWNKAACRSAAFSNGHCVMVAWIDGCQQ